MNKKLLIILSIAVLLTSGLKAGVSDSVYFTTGFKVGELTANSVLIWTQLCKQPVPVSIKHKQKAAPFKNPINFDNNMPVYEMDGAVEGVFGQIKITLKSNTTTVSTNWKYVSPYKDFTLKEEISGLEPNTNYKITIQGRKNEDAPITEITGHFTTAPSENDIVPLTFTVSTGQYFWDYDDSIRGFKIYDQMLKLNPLFYCQTGDYVYYDKPGPMANTVELARHKWHAINSWKSLTEFFAHTPLFIQKDDHDILKDDATPYSSPFGELTYEDGLSIWYEQVPVQEKPYRTLRWGKDIQVWIVEGREYRIDNQEPDGPDKTIWGKEQKEWFVKTVKNSKATFKILISPTPVVGPDRLNKQDNHANLAFKTEGDWLRQFLSDNEMFIVCGDRHWQYISQDKKTGVMEFCSGPASDAHSQGWKQSDIRPEHKFLRVKGGFLAVKVFRENNSPVLKFTHYDVDGNVVNEEVITKRKCKY